MIGSGVIKLATESRYVHLDEVGPRRVIVTPRVIVHLHSAEQLTTMMDEQFEDGMFLARHRERLAGDGNPVRSCIDGDISGMED